MDSKKLGMFAAAALTVLAAQANAKDNKAAPAAAAKADGEMVCMGTCAPGCSGKIREGVKDEAACTTAKGNWIAKTANAETHKDGKAHDHKHK